MLRFFQIKEQRPCDATFKAAGERKPGMLLKYDYATKTVDVADSATTTNVAFVNKAPVPYGLNAARADFSDYDEQFNTIKEGEFVVLNMLDNADVIGIDQFDNTLVANDFVEAGTDGKVVKASGTTHFQFLGTYNDNGHTLARVRYVD